MSHGKTLCVGVLLVWATTLCAQQILPGQEQNQFGNLPVQKIGAGDLLSLSVFDSPELTRTVRVTSQGTIRLPMVKEPIKVIGLLPSDIEILIGESLQREGLLVDPYVTVNVSEYHSRPVSVMGNVKSPTIFQAIGDVTLLDALARAGGLMDSAGGEIIVTRPNGDNGEQSVQRIPVKQLIDGSDPTLNIKMLGGEEIRVPQVGQIVVAGNVTHPGSFPILDPATTTVSTMIAQASGLAQYYNHKAYVYRPDDQGNKHEIEIDLWGILQRKSPDVILQARDILYVPDSSGRRITQEMVNALTSFGTTASAGVLVYRAH